MKITNVRKGRILKTCAYSAIVLFLIYLIISWFHNDNKSFGNYLPDHIINSKIKSVKHDEVPVLVNGLGNFEPRNLKKVIGPGEEGVPHTVADDKANDAAESESQYGMNIAVSDEISMNRSIPDTRMEECRHWDYPTALPKTSVIVVFHNEGFSVLMRTVHTVISRSPSDILHEVLLVDDFSSKDDLGSKLESYIKQWSGKVRLVRNAEREGLIRSRSRGAFEATGEVIVFLDAHCEVNLNWLPPLLAPIYRDPTVMSVPIIDGIDHRTFAYSPVYSAGHHFRGIFEWGMLYKETEVPDQEKQRRAHNSEPYKSPTHAGGLFAMNRKYFLDLGAYDPGLLVWGGENFELSFKIWQCGGSIEWVPCSRVGHVYRGFMPYNFGRLAEKKKGSLITINYKRVIETWFDEEHKEFFYTREPMARFLDMGDISAQVAMKERLQCKDFKWFMENIAYDVYDKFPKLPPNIHWGMVRNIATSSCLDTLGRAAPAYLGTSPCHGSGNNQLFRLNSAGQLGSGERCVEADGQGIKLAICKLGTVAGPWIYSSDTRHLSHKKYQKCLSRHPQKSTLLLVPCDSQNTFQQWVITQLKPKW